jgi:hypothetical protein
MIAAARNDLQAGAQMQVLSQSLPQLSRACNMMFSLPMVTKDKRQRLRFLAASYTGC